MSFQQHFSTTNNEFKLKVVLHSIHNGLKKRGFDEKNMMRERERGVGGETDREGKRERMLHHIFEERRKVTVHSTC